VLQVSIATDQREFHIGEAIPLQLAFSSNVKERYQVNMAQYDRSGRMNYEHFDVSPADGAVDPLSTYTGSMGGKTNFKYLSSEPWTISSTKRMGTLHSARRVPNRSFQRQGRRTRSVKTAEPPATARSNEVALKIISAILRGETSPPRAVAALDAAAPAKPKQMEQYTASRRQALETVRFLGSGDAARELAKRMRVKILGDSTISACSV
jgi:hypothetical protein